MSATIASTATTAAVSDSATKISIESINTELTDNLTKQQEEDCIKILLNCLESFDKEDNGMMDTKTFIELLTTMGDPLGSEEIDELFKLNTNNIPKINAKISERDKY